MIEIGDLCKYFNLNDVSADEDLKMPKVTENVWNHFHTSNAINARNDQTIRVHRSSHKCDICDYECAEPGEMEKHKLLHMGELQSTHELSNHNTENASDLGEHTNTNKRGKPFTCEFCDYRTAFRKTLRKHEKKLHAGMKAYKCDLCNYKAIDSTDLNAHKLKHKAEHYVCVICDLKCGTFSKLKKHRFVHSEEKYYTCDLCDFTTRKRKNLRKHMIIHT